MLCILRLSYCLRQTISAALLCCSSGFRIALMRLKEIYMRPMTVFRAVLISATAGLLLLPSANAQDRTPPSATMPKTTTAPANISDKKLDAAAAAAKKVSALNESYQGKIAKASDPDKKRLTDEANAAMKTAITDQGLSVEEYKNIIEVAQNDPAVRNKLLQRLQ